MANVYKGLTVQFGGDTSELQKALKQATSAASNTQAQLKKLNNDLKFDDDNVVALQQKFSLLTDAIGDSQVKLQLYEKTADQLADTIVTVNGVTTTVKQLAEETENVGLSASEALQAYNTIDGALENVNVQLSKMEEALIEAGEASDNTYIAVNKMSSVQFNQLISDLISAGDLTSENAQAIHDLKERYVELANNNAAYKMANQFENLQTTIADTNAQTEKFRKELIDMDVESISDLGVYFDDAARAINISAQAIDAMDTSVDDYQSAIQQLDTKMKSHGTTTDDLTLKYQLLEDETQALKIKQSELESSFGIDESAISTISSATVALSSLAEKASYSTVSLHDVAEATGLSADESREIAEAINAIDWTNISDGTATFEELAVKLGLVDESMESSVATYVALTKKSEDLHQEMLAASDTYAQAKGYVDQLTNEYETQVRTLDALNGELATTEAKLSSGIFDEENGETIESLDKKIEDLTEDIAEQKEAIAETTEKLAEAKEAAEQAEAVFNDTKVAESIGEVRDEVLGIDTEIETVRDTSSQTVSQIIADIEKQEAEWKSLTESIDNHARQIDELETDYLKAAIAVDDFSSAVDEDALAGMERLETLATKAEQAIENAFDAEYPRDFAMELDGVEVAAQSIQSELSKVEAALQFDPTSPELLATKMELLEEDIRATGTQAAATEAVMDDMGNAVALLATQTSDAATDAAAAKSRYNELTTQLEAMCAPITEATHLTGDLGDEFDLFSTMGTGATEEIISGLTEMGYITEEQADNLHEVADEWSAAKEEMDATEQVQEYKQLSTQLQTLETHASAAADQLAQMKLDQTLTADVADVTETVKVLDSHLEETETALSRVQKQMQLDPTNIELSTTAAKLLDKYTEEAGEKMQVLKKRIGEIESSGIEASGKSMYELANEVEDAKDNFVECAKKVSTLENELKSAKEKMQDLEDSAEDVSEEYQDAAEQVSKYEDALKDARQEQEKAADELESANMAQEWKELTSEVENTEDALQDVKVAASEVETKTKTAANKTEQSFNSATYSIEDMFQTIEQFGDKAIDVFENIIESAADVDEAFINMKKTTEGTEEEFDELLDSAKEMSTTSAVSADTILEIEELGGQLGIAADDLDDFAETISNISLATDLDADEAAEEIGSLINILDDLNTGNLDEFADALVRLGNNGASTEEDIVDIAERIAAVGSQAGMSTPEILAWASTIASTGSEAESAGTAISNTMSDIETAVAGGGEELELFAEIAGMSAEEFATAWEEDPSYALQTFIEGLASMEDSGESSITALEELGITSVRQVTNIENLASSIGLLDDNLTMSEDAWNGVSDEWGEAGDAANEAEQASEGLSGTLAILQNALQVLASEVGEAVQPLLESLTEAVIDLTEWIGTVDEDTIQLVVELSAFAAVAGVAGEGVTSLTRGLSTVGNKVSSAIGSVKSIATAFKTAASSSEGLVSSLSTAISTTAGASSAVASLTSALKGGLVAVGITAAIVAIKELVDWMDSFTEIQDEAAENSAELDEAEQDLADAFDIASDAEEYNTDTLDDVTVYTEDLIDRTEDLAETVEDSYDDMFDSIGDISDATTVLTDFVNSQNDFQDSTNLSASTVEELEEAVDIYNEALGTSYSVMENADGSFSIVDEACVDAEGNFEDVTDSILGMSDDALWDTVMNTIATNMETISSEITENSDQSAEIEVKIDSKEDAISELFDKYIDEANEAGSEDGAAWYESWEEKIRESGYDSDVIAEFTATANSMTNAYGGWDDEDLEALRTYGDEIVALTDEQSDYLDNTDLLESELEALQRVYESLDSGSASEELTNFALEAGDSFESIVTLAEASVEGGTEILAQGLSEAGVSTDEFLALSTADMQTLLSEWDGTTGNLKVLLSEYGLTLDETQQSTAETFDEFGNNIATMTDSSGEELQILVSLFQGNFETLKGYADLYGVEIPNGLIEGLEDGSIALDESALGMIQTVMDDMTQADLYALAETVGAEIPEGITQALANGGDLTTEQTEALASAIITQFCTSMGISSPSDEMITLGDYVIKGLVEGMSDTDTVTEATQTMAQTIIDVATESLSTFGTDITTTMFGGGEEGNGLVSQMETYGTEMATGLATGISAGTDNVTTAVSTLMETATGTLGEDFKTTMTTKGVAGATGFVIGLTTESEDEVVGAGEALSSYVLDDGLGDFEGDMTDAGEEGGAGFVSGIRSKGEKANSAGEYIAGRAWTGSKSRNGYGSNTAYSSGQNFAKGYARGIRSESSTVYNAATYIASQAYAAVNDYQDSASPSKLMRKVGQWFGEGYAMGIEDMYSDVEKAAAKTAAVAIEAASAEAVDVVNITTTAQADTLNEAVEALNRLNISADRNSENVGTVINQTFDTKVVRSDSDLYTAAPIIYRNAMREALLV